MEIDKAKAEIVEVIREMWGRKHANTTGVAVSVRIPDGRLLVNPSGTGYRRCKVDESAILTLDADCSFIAGVSERRAPVNTFIHARFYEEFPLAHACVHCHPPYANVFAGLGKSILPFTLQSNLIGEVPCIMVDDVEKKREYFKYKLEESVPSGLGNRPEVFHVMKAAAEEAIRVLQPRSFELKMHGLAFTLYRHGVFVFGRNLGEAFDNLERIEYNAQAVILSRLVR